MKLLEQIQNLNFPAPLPDTLLSVQQIFEAPKIDDIIAGTKQALAESGLLENMKPGASVAVGVGSRGIANIPAIVRTVIGCMKEAGLNPYIVPVMGSHGGATAKGQLDVLTELGIIEESVGAEIRATMEVKQIGQIDDGPPLFQDLNATEADHTFLIGRIKPHTDFRSTLESGLAKMEVIGLGKQHGAALMHSMGVEGFQKYLAPAARIYETNTNVIGGLAILENAYEETAELICLSAAEIGTEKEVELQEKAKNLLASLPFPEIDILVVKEIGKNISGAGMDTNIIGRLMIPRQAENFGGPDIAIIVVLSLTEVTHGNASGIGLANVTTARVAQEIDWYSTYMNAITAGIAGVMRNTLPITLPSDQSAIQVGFRSCARTASDARYVFIDNTLSLEHLWVSPNLRAEVEAHPRLSIEAEVPLTFSTAGVITSPWKLGD